MLEPSISDFARRTPIRITKLAATPNQTLEQISQSTNSNVNLFGKNNKLVNNIDTSKAVQIQQAQMNKGDMHY